MLDIMINLIDKNGRQWSVSEQLQIIRLIHNIHTLYISYISKFEIPPTPLTIGTVKYEIRHSAHIMKRHS